MNGEKGEVTRRIDLYRKGSFVLEAKQGVEAEVAAEAEQRVLDGKKPTKKGHGTRGTKGWDTFMRRAREQAEGYVKLLPASEGRPPFILVVDVGHVIEIYAEFTRTGGAYLPFPSARTNRIGLADLEKPEVRELLRQIWLEPMELNPALKAAQVTREVAATLATISRRMEGQPDANGHIMTPERVSNFLMRMIFTMFAEDVGLIGKSKLRQALEGIRETPEAFMPIMDEIWRNMATGGYSVALKEKLKYFNGGLFANAEVLPVTPENLDLLIAASEYDWSKVEPSIFGTLVERALDPVERHKLGAHYTPRPYVERLVNQVVLSPLREDWRGVQVEIQATLDKAKDQAKGEVKARELVETFLTKLLTVTVLDPACGTGNFLYVSMELIKKLEAEVVETLEKLGGPAPLAEVNPEQFQGLEINPRAASVAELVLWIGYLQIYARNHGKASPPEPILRAFRNIKQTDALLAYSSKKPHISKDGQPVTRWDGRTTAQDPVTKRQVPDPDARVHDTLYLNARPVLWPVTTFIVGNPPFLGAGPMREALGDGYVQALRETYKPTKKLVGVPDSADLVMYWWHKAAALMRDNDRVRRFGFVTTNSVKQTFNRRVVEDHLKASVEASRPLSLVYAVPDHPWVDEADGAAVRISMTVVARGRRDGLLERVLQELPGENGEYAITTAQQVGRINPDLTIGADVTAAAELKANQGISGRGVQLMGAGFIVPVQTTANPENGHKEVDAADLGLGRVPGIEGVLREYRNGRDLTSRPRAVRVIDLFGLNEEEARTRFPEIYQHVRLTVKPERDANNRATYRDNWWLFGEPRSALRPALGGLPRFIATVETSKHRFFQFLPSTILPDNMLVNIAHDDAYVLGVLSSRVHVVWALAQGSRLGVGNDPRYNKSRCFETFPFPVATPAQQQAIREKAEALDAFRKARLAAHAHLTMTDLYNVLDSLRQGTELTVKERRTLQDGVVTELRTLHDELDELIQAAYGWEGQLKESDILTNLMALNVQRAEAERSGHIEYLRPEYQDPRGTTVRGLGLQIVAPLAAKGIPHPYPPSLAERAVAIREVLLHAEQPLSAGQLAGMFEGARAPAVGEVLEMLVVLGQARHVTGTAAYAA
ncbi:hypothetical protein GCM10008960_41150 [Deinococcus sedimenti]|uniref:site-specific DNA-methyltransferase (adenine-specific) n=1 Tax=Deinococcus sedimenti TaxID=1867090 RepID=A0ABQ2SBS7_9DEIO|nr:hypothetical protein GCM10008960_41150 [Deinococcus sedimenti]